MSESKTSPRQKVNRVPLHTTSLSYVVRAEIGKKIKYFEIRSNRLFIGKESDSTGIEGWNVLMKRVRVHRWKNTRDLSFSFSWRADVSNQTLKSLTTKHYRDYFKLNRLSIEMPWQSTVTDEGLDSFLLDFAQNSINLRHLSIPFSNLRYVTSRGYKVIAFLFRQHVTRLKSYDLQFRSEDIFEKEKATELMSVIWRYLRGLETLRLWLSNCKDDALEAKISKIISSQKRLRSFRLGIYWNDKVNNDFLRAIVSKVTTCLANLDHLTLDFYQCKMIHDTVFKGLASKLGQTLKQLISFALSIKCCRRVTDKALIHLGSELAENMPQLQQLCLNFETSTNISDKGLESAVSNIVSNLVHLRVLHLSFDSCVKITNAGNQALGNLLMKQQLPHLRDLRLSFGNQIKFKGFKTFTPELAANLAGLNFLTLCFSELSIYKISQDKFKKIIANFLAHLTNLKYLSISFTSKVGDTESLKIYLKETLGFIPELRFNFDIL